MKLWKGENCPCYCVIMLLCIMPLNQEQRGVGGGFFRLDPVCALLPRTRRVLLYTGFDVEINAGRVDEKGENFLH